MRSRDQAICVRTTDFSETSQVVHFFTRSGGLVHLLAKGAKRPKSSSGGAIDLMSEGELVYTTSSRQGMGTLIEFSESVSHSSLRRDSARLNTALYMIELVGNMLAEADPHAEVFDLLHNSLSRLAQDDAPLPAVLAYFQWRLLRHVGLLGDMASCVLCNCPILLPGGGRHDDIYFSSLQGGLLCKACQAPVADKYLLDEPARGALAVLIAVESGRRMPLTDAQACKANRLLSHHIRWQLGKQLKMAKHVIV